MQLAREYGSRSPLWGLENFCQNTVLLGAIICEQCGCVLAIVTQFSSFKACNLILFNISRHTQEFHATRILQFYLNKMVDQHILNMQPSYCYQQQAVDWAGGWGEHFYANEEMQTVEKSLLDELSRKKFRICFTPYLQVHSHNIGNNRSTPPIWSCYLLKAQHIVLMMPGPLKK